MANILDHIIEALAGAALAVVGFLYQRGQRRFTSLEEGQADLKTDVAVLKSENSHMKEWLERVEKKLDRALE